MGNSITRVASAVEFTVPIESAFLVSVATLGIAERALMFESV